uniref:pistil-specific extensin-like protein isoform X1 n=1 Tax=Lonchura striata TaxID=40157 RepID=UPI00129392DC|nr:pistil-specific extensin-like protein isoform X1 [Lonchura striata domestica]
MCCRPGVSLVISVALTAALLPEVAKVLPNSFSQDFRDPWRRAGLPLPEEPSGYVWSRGPSVTPLPKAGTPLHPLWSWALCTPRPRAFFLPPDITFLPALNHGPVAPPYKTMALCMPHRTAILPTLQIRIPLHPPRAITLLTSPAETPLPPPKPISPLYPNPSTNRRNLCPTFRPPFSLFSRPIFPPPQLPLPRLLRLFPPDAGGSPVPRARLEPPAAAGQAGVCGVLGESVPPPPPLHWTRAARSQDILGGRFCGGVPGLLGAGEPAGGVCLLPTSSHFCVGSPQEGLLFTLGASSLCFPLNNLLKNGKTLLIKTKNKGIAEVW